jgi:hypothetical protein
VGDDPIDPTPDATPTPTLEPTPTPTLEITEAPSVGPVEMTITVDALEGKAKIGWSAYAGENFAYYKVVRSTDETATWPLGTGDSLVAAISEKATLTYTDSCGAGTFTYRVFAVESTGTDYVVLGQTPGKTVTIAAPAKTEPPAPPAAPVSDPADMGGLTVKDNGDGTYTFSWYTYTGGIAISYYKLDGETYPKTPGYVENGGHYWAAIGTSCTSATVSIQPGTWNINVEAVYYPAGGSAAAGKTHQDGTAGPLTLAERGPAV